MLNKIAIASIICTALGTGAAFAQAQAGGPVGSAPSAYPTTNSQPGRTSLGDKGPAIGQDRKDSGVSALPTNGSTVSRDEAGAGAR